MNAEIIKRCADLRPPSMPKTPVGFDRVAGMMLGLAIGDSLGNTSEGMRPAERRGLFGEVTDYLANRRSDQERVGLPSDDTQLAFWTLEQLLEDNGLVPERLAERFCRQPIYGIGSTVGSFVSNFHAGIPWDQCGPASAGNGALMRIAPVLIPHLPAPSAKLWTDAAEGSLLTHDDPASAGACVAFVAMLWDLLQMPSPPEPRWYLDRYVSVAAKVEEESEYRPRGGRYTDYCGPVWRFVNTAVREALDEGMTTLEACNSWYSGAFLLETVPSALYVLARHGDDPEQAIVRAVNDTVDNDTIAAIVGAAMGVLHGASALPERWREGLLGRTACDDDGRVIELLAKARQRWGTGT